ncbi:DUF309 domain-containing protein [Albibacillus kandeliae]|uniref:DUF309 domain-containing protein n=1 Tax=Albibacillus kandeliae TaxID=2174228 RepID=UPI000D69374D|nr:DUF309 domain-containing protein [Albibacillus kandeliae]
MKRPDDIPLPPYAYVPGRDARHAESAFDAFHNSVQPGMSVAQLSETLAWRAGWYYIERGYHWEAHEVLEPVWMNLPPHSAEQQFVQGVIQAANAALKLRMDRPKATRRLCDIAEDHLAACDGMTEVMSLPLAAVRDLVAALRERAILATAQ